MSYELSVDARLSAADTLRLRRGDYDNLEPATVEVVSSDAYVSKAPTIARPALLGAEVVIEQ